MIHRPARVLGLALGLATTPLLGQVVVSGVVREDGTRRPLASVEVLIEGTKRADTTDNSGRYRLDAPTGNRVALFRLIGFRPVRLRLVFNKGDSVIADVELVRESAQQLEPIETTARPNAPRGLGVGRVGEPKWRPGPFEHHRAHRTDPFRT